MKQMYYLLLLLTLVIAEETNYCGLCRGSHTMCRYKSPKPSNQCTDYKSAKLESSEKEELLKRHNDLRAHVANGKEKRGNPGPQPPATNLKPLQWDSELAMIAQRWANQCSFGHDTWRNVERFQVGQNVATISGGNSRNLKHMVYLWYDEVKDFDHNLVTEYEHSMKIGHYAQMMWADTKKIGCGAVTYNGGNDYYGDTTLLVCNYGPAGNRQGQTVYRFPGEKKSLNVRKKWIDFIYGWFQNLSSIL